MEGEPSDRWTGRQASVASFQKLLSLAHPLRFFKRWNPLMNDDRLGQFWGDELHEATTGTEAVMLVVSREAIPRRSVRGATAL